MGKDGALPQHLHARAAIVGFLLALVALGVFASLPGGAEEPSPQADAAASGDPATGEAAPDTAAVVTEAPAATRAIAGLGNGRELRARAQEQAAAEAAATTASTAPPTTAPPVTAAVTVPPTTAPPTTAPPTTAPPTTAPPTTAAPAPAAPAGAGVWDAIAACESGGRWDLNTGNGYFGGLQFLQSTWEIHGGTAFAPGPHLASRDAEIAVAERVVAASGGSYRAWGACASRLGLP